MSWIEKWGRYLALAVLILMWPVIDNYQRGVVGGVRAGVYGALAVSFALVYCWFCLLGSRSSGWQAALLTVISLTALAVTLNHLSAQLDDNLYLIPTMVAGFSLPTRIAIVALACIAAVAGTDGFLISRTPNGRAVLDAAIVVPIGLLFGGGAMGVRYLLRTVSDLRSARAEIARHAADKERMRIARDLHDLLGHNLSLITLKGELATRLLPEAAPGANEVRDMLNLSREALQQVREVVSGYRQPTLATELMAAKLALQAASIDLDVMQGVGALDRESEAVLGWIIREATTNVIRHSGAKHCRIALARDNGRLSVEVTNDGWKVPVAPAGNGLRGLQERLAGLGGTLEASALPNSGFRLMATLPVRDSALALTQVESAR
jgi:two-component system sensor histidine kinase DesK